MTKLAEYKCTHPLHKRWLAYRQAKIIATGGYVSPRMRGLPNWKTSMEDQSPRKVHIQIFKDDRLEAEIRIRPCRWCLVQLLVGHLALNKKFVYKRNEDLANYLFGHSKFKKLWEIDRRLRKLRPIELAVRVVLNQLGVPLIPIEELESLPDDNTPLRYKRPPGHDSEAKAG